MIRGGGMGLNWGKVAKLGENLRWLNWVSMWLNWVNLGVVKLGETGVAKLGEPWGS